MNRAPDRHSREEKIVFASSSPRRQEIARQLGLDFVTQPVNTDEAPLSSEKPGETARRLAAAKAGAAAASLARGIVVAADTIVVLDNGVLGKPAGPNEARRMLRHLRSRPHEVITAIAIENAATHKRFTSNVSTRVWMRDYSDAAIEDYVRSGEPIDKAGAYAIQSTIARMVDRIDGCYLNVVGLPACELIRGLEEVGYRVSSATRERLARLCPECAGRAQGHA